MLYGECRRSAQSPRLFCPCRPFYFAAAAGVSNGLLGFGGELYLHQLVGILMKSSTAASGHGEVMATLPLSLLNEPPTTPFLVGIML